MTQYFCTAYIDPYTTDQLYVAETASYELAIVTQCVKPLCIKWKDDVKALNPDIKMLCYMMLIEETTVPGPGHDIMRKLVHSDVYVTYSNQTMPYIGDVSKPRRLFDPRKPLWKPNFISACVAALNSYPYDGLYLDQAGIFDRHIADTGSEAVRDEMYAAVQEAILDLRRLYPDLLMVGNTSHNYIGLNGEMNEHRPQYASTELPSIQGQILPNLNMIRTRLTSVDAVNEIRAGRAVADQYNAWFGASINNQTIIHREGLEI